MGVRANLGVKQEAQEREEGEPAARLVKREVRAVWVV